VDNIEHLLAVKTRLTTIRGYAQLLEREINRTNAPSDRLSMRVAELNREIVRLIELVGYIEATIHDDTVQELEPGRDDYLSSGC
jgi:hypothetical protein